MSEPDQPDRVQEPPRPVWVRVPPRGRQTEAYGVEGLLLAWVRREEYGRWEWRAKVAVDDDVRVIPGSSVLPRD